MKTLVLSILMGIASLAIGQDITPKLVGALESGNAGALSGMFTKNVDLTILDDEDMYAQDEAKKRLATFFASHKPQSFVIKHEGTSKLDDQYRIGDLKTSNGTFRVTFFIKKNEQGMKVKQFRIEDFDDDF